VEYNSPIAKHNLEKVNKLIFNKKKLLHEYFSWNIFNSLFLRNLTLQTPMFVPLKKSDIQRGRKKYVSLFLHNRYTKRLIWGRFNLKF